MSETMSGADSHDSQFSKERLEMLCDGIFAIAMTLLVLELKPPDLPHQSTSTEIIHALHEHGMAFVGFVLTFLLAGQFWILHHILMICLQPLSFAISMAVAFVAPRQAMTSLAITQAANGLLSRRLASRR